MYFHFSPPIHTGGFEDDCPDSGARFWGGSWNNSQHGGKGPTNKPKKKTAEEKPKPKASAPSEATAVKEEAKSSA